ncbi:MAG TPA: hypothetical protein VG820_06205 [Fimbriimonadaceae bacterium]|nr:hypothetical protein [Fimbriimonadaceae bacterium]
MSLGRHGAAFAIFGAIGVGVTLFMATQGDAQRVEALHSYLFAVMFFLSMTLGCFALTMLQHVLQAKWGLPILRIFEAGGGWKNFLLMAVLFVPILYYAKDLYPWARPEQVAQDAVLAHRADHYLNWTDILVRFAVYFGVWIAYAVFLRRSVKLQEATRRFKLQQVRTNWAAPGLVFIVLSVTFAYTDYVMALDPHWWSTMYGLWFVAGMGLNAVSFAALISALNAHKPPYNHFVTKSWFNDIGNLMFTFTMLWGYTNLGQYLIIWHGNLPETATYLVNRSLGHWSYLSFALVIGQFFIPFFALLSPNTKKDPKRLAIVASWILLMRVLDHFHVIEPFFRAEMTVHLADLLAFVGVGGLWALIFSLNVKSEPLFPTYDPRILEVEHAH